MSEQRSTTLGDLLKRVQSGAVSGVRVSVPGKVVTYDRTRGCVSVQPLVRERREDKDTGEVVIERLPVILNVPVAFYRAGGMHVVFPLKPGDTGMIEFTDAPMDAWRSEGGEVSPEESRSFTLTDCIFQPGVRSFKGALPLPDFDGLVLGDEHATELLRAVLGEPLRDYLSDLVSWLRTHTHPSEGSAPSDGPPSVPSADALLSASVKLTS